MRKGKSALRTPSQGNHDLVKTAHLRKLVYEICDEDGIKPPAWIAVLGNEKRRSNAMAVRIGRMGSGFLVITPALFADLDDQERRFILRHELAHYRHAESRWALLQAAAFFSPFAVFVFGNAIADVIGELATLVLYFAALLAHALAFRSKRFFERRADREAIRSAEDALIAKRTLLKVSTLKKRKFLESRGRRVEASRELVELERAARESANLSLRVFNAIWGTHPLIQERLRTYESLIGDEPLQLTGDRPATTTYA